MPAVGRAGRSPYSPRSSVCPRPLTTGSAWLRIPEWDQLDVSDSGFHWAEDMGKLGVCAFLAYVILSAAILLLEMSVRSHLVFLESIMDVCWAA